MTKSAACILCSIHCCVVNVRLAVGCCLHGHMLICFTARSGRCLLNAWACASCITVHMGAAAAVLLYQDVG